MTAVSLKQKAVSLMKNVLIGFLVLGLGIIGLANAQSNSPAPIISAENVASLQSATTFDFTDLPADVLPSSGLFAVNADGTKLVTFGRYSDTPPLSLVVMWGYDDMPRINRIDDGSISRVLSDDGRCLYLGYREYFAVWELQPEADMARLVHRSRSFVGDAVNNIWVNHDAGQILNPCSTLVYAEFIAADGSMFVVDYNGELIQERLFPRENDDEIFARVGRIDPPIALTVTALGEIYRWDMFSNQVVATVQTEDIATYGAMNRGGTHYVWLAQNYTGLYVVEWDTATNRLLAPLGGDYISHLDVGLDGTVVIGTDPQDSEGTVSAWLVETGERFDLGPYRQCDRIQPDQVELSRDGTALIIGCDRGLDIWRVVQ